MAKYQCNEHGRQAAFIICEHLAKAVESKHPLGFHSRMDELIGGIQLLCDACYSKRERVRAKVDFEPFAGSLSGVCEVCFKDWQNIRV